MTASSPLRSRIRTDRLPSRSGPELVHHQFFDVLAHDRVRCLASGSVGSVTRHRTRMPGLMVAEMVTDRMYVPLAAAGLTVRRWFRNALMFSSSCVSVKFSLPTGAATFPPLSLRNSILPALNSRTAEAMSVVTVPGAGRGHQPAGAEHAAERADDAHHVGRGQGDVEVHEAPLDLAAPGRRRRRCRPRRRVAFSAFSPWAKTATRTLLPMPCGKATDPRTFWSLCRGSIPRLVETSTVWLNFVVPNAFKMPHRFGQGDRTARLSPSRATRDSASNDRQGRAPFAEGCRRSSDSAPAYRRAVAPKQAVSTWLDQID